MLLASFLSYRLYNMFKYLVGLLCRSVSVCVHMCLRVPLWSCVGLWGSVHLCRSLWIDMGLLCMSFLISVGAIGASGVFLGVSQVVGVSR